MKLLALALLLWAAPAAAQDALACVQSAEASLLSENQAFALCQGARSSGPADCFAAADAETPLSQDQAVALCRCAESRGPVDCYARGDDDTTLSDQQLLSLCAPTLTEYLTPSCQSYVPQIIVLPETPEE
jgi:hypothetical protein